MIQLNDFNVDEVLIWINLNIIHQRVLFDHLLLLSCFAQMNQDELWKLSEFLPVPAQILCAPVTTEKAPALIEKKNQMR